MTSPLAGRYAVIAATLALVVALAGTSYAAVKIGTKQLKANAVTSAKVKKDTLTGADIKESSLGAVPSATNAGAVNGVRISKISFRRDSDVGPTVLFNKVGLVITASCSSSDITLVATTNTANSYISTTVSRDSNPDDPLQDDLEGSDFDPGDTFNLLATEDGDTNHVEFAFSSPTGAVATGSIDTDEITPDCLAAGFVTSG